MKENTPKNSRNGNKRVNVKINLSQEYLFILSFANYILDEDLVERILESIFKTFNSSRERKTPEHN
ncbi:MAG: hypothetical protein R2860_01370 [Desulfobacterales bacterium]